MEEKQRHTNRLIREKSLYLLQHAHNPVDWYPWGEEAFQAAQTQNKPIFLSIGYATCHWCHVMEKESFENEEIATLMNETFINIKIDREELPEIDNLYMEFAQTLMSGAAGWPLNVILTPDLKPFFAVTYLPPKNRQGMMGLQELIEKIQQIWGNEEEQEQVLEQSTKIVEIFAENQHVKGFAIPPKETVEDSMEILYQLADAVYGGIKGVPKFPIGYHINFFLAYSVKTQDSRAIFLAEKTLDQMHRGGIYDHLGGGFCRYSVDEQWLVPHFEKMLYDNAILALSYCRAWQTTHNPIYEKTAKEILDYILRDMTHPEGGFYSAEDSDSEGKEGHFYTWTFAEIKKILNPKDAEIFCDFYQVTAEGNFNGRNILHIPIPLEEFANQHQFDPKELESRLQTLKHKLWLEREKRVHPLKDDKILSSWCGLMIQSLAIAGSCLKERKYIDAAVKAAQFIRKNLWKNGYLLHRWREGQEQYTAGLDDYAFLIRGMLSLFEANCGSEWLQWAIEMVDILQKDFKEEKGAFYQSNGQDQNIIVQKCHFADSAEPSGNAVHCENLLRLHQITGNPEYLAQAEDILRAAKHYLDTYPPGYIYSVLNLLRYYDTDQPTFTIILNEKEEHHREISEMIRSRFIPYRAIIWHKEKDPTLPTIIPSLKSQRCINGKTTLYICKHGTCLEPLTTLEKMKEGIDKF